MSAVLSLPFSACRALYARCIAAHVEYTVLHYAVVSAIYHVMPISVVWLCKYIVSMPVNNRTCVLRLLENSGDL